MDQRKSESILRKTAPFIQYHLSPIQKSHGTAIIIFTKSVILLNAFFKKSNGFVELLLVMILWMSLFCLLSILLPS